MSAPSNAELSPLSHIINGTVSLEPKERLRRIGNGEFVISPQCFIAINNFFISSCARNMIDNDGVNVFFALMHSIPKNIFSPTILEQSLITIISEVHNWRDPTRLRNNEPSDIKFTNLYQHGLMQSFLSEDPIKSQAATAEIFELHELKKSGKVSAEIKSPIESIFSCEPLQINNNNLQAMSLMLGKFTEMLQNEKPKLLELLLSKNRGSEKSIMELITKQRNSIQSALLDTRTPLPTQECFATLKVMNGFLSQIFTMEIPANLPKNLKTEFASAKAQFERGKKEKEEVEEKEQPPAPDNVEKFSLKKLVAGLCGGRGGGSD